MIGALVVIFLPRELEHWGSNSKHQSVSPQQCRVGPRRSAPRIHGLIPRLVRASRRKGRSSSAGVLLAARLPLRVPTKPLPAGDGHPAVERSIPGYCSPMHPPMEHMQPPGPRTGLQRPGATVRVAMQLVAEAPLVFGWQPATKAVSIPLFPCPGPPTESKSCLIDRCVVCLLWHVLVARQQSTGYDDSTVEDDGKAAYVCVYSRKLDVR